MRSRHSSTARTDSTTNSIIGSRSNTSRHNSYYHQHPKNMQHKPIIMTSSSSSTTTTTTIQWTAIIVATIYVLSGATQPLLMTLVKSIGLGDPTCQVYMLFYYIGPTLVIFSLCCSPLSSPLSSSNNDDNNTNNHVIPPPKIIFKASSIAILDIIAQSMNYTGSTMAGPTIFAIIYSSVTIWTAIYSYLLLSRNLSFIQWSSIIIVFFGLLLTSINSISVGQHVFHGTILIIVGSSLHALTYVLSEIIMTHEKLSLQLNCSIQGIVACIIYLIWQCIYTRRYYNEKIAIPMMNNGTTITFALLVLFSLSTSNLIHATSFFYTLKYFPGGATSAGVMKGLQAVLVFVFSSLVYCHYEVEEVVEPGGGTGEEVVKTMTTSLYGGEEMCFTTVKFVSLVVVLTGVILFAVTTDGLSHHGNYGRSTSSNSSGSSDDHHRPTLPFRARKEGYQPIGSFNSSDDEQYGEREGNNDLHRINTIA